MYFLVILINIYSMLIFVRVLLSWVPIDPRTPGIETLFQITDPYLDLFRKILPPMGGLDFSPIIALMVLQVLARALSAV